MTSTTVIRLLGAVLAISQGVAGFDIEGPFDINTPVHETLTLSALMHSAFGAPKDLTVDDAPLDLKEFFRGDMWNDDPECQLFDDKDDDNVAPSGLLVRYGFSVGLFRLSTRSYRSAPWSSRRVLAPKKGPGPRCA